MEVTLALLPWLLPPVLGAIIGYITNRIAIQMLFRPRTARHIFGIRIPFTPGIIPKSRDELARNVGKAVARELLSADAILAQLDSPQLQTSLRQWVRQQRQSLLRQPLSGLLALFPATETALDDYLTERLIAFLGEQTTELTGILNVEELVTERISAFDDAQVERLVLDVTGQHLKWINYFGAGLGAVIGLIQVGIYLIT